MKFSVFSDFHHGPGRYPKAGFEELDIIQKRAEEENVDFIIHAGDLCHGPTFYRDFIKKYNDFHIPSYHVLGNHDTDCSSLDDTMELYKLSSCYYSFDCKGYRMIVFDPNFCRVGDEFIHYERGNYYKLGNNRDWIPPEELEWLRKTIFESPYPCILIGHGSFERPDGIKNREECLEMFREANRKKPHSVLMIMNGHYHRDNIRIVDGICHYEINSCSIEYVGNAHRLYPEAMYKEVWNLPYCFIMNRPVHPVITVEGTTVTVEGMDGSWFLGIPPSASDNSRYDRAGREATASVRSAKFSLG